MNFKPVTHVLFDMDGLLLNTEDLYWVAYNKIASRFGKQFTFALKCKIMGQQSREFASVIIDDLGLPMSVDEFLQELRNIVNELFPTCKILPGVKRLVKHLHKHKIPMGLATSSAIESYNLKVVHHKELFDLLPYKTWGTSDPEVKKGKPHPDIFYVAAAKFPDKPKPEQCLVFEDSVNGVKAAHAAGMQVVLVPDPRLDRDLAPEATHILDSMEHFNPVVFGLPPFDDY